MTILARIRTARRALLGALASASVLGIQGCCPPLCISNPNPGTPPSPPANTEIATTFAMPLGTVNNVVDIDKLYYAGPNTVAFKLGFSFSPERPQNISLKLVRPDGSVFQEFPAGGTAIFGSAEILGNQIRIVISSSGQRIAGAGPFELLIGSVFTVMSPGQVSPRLALPYGEEVIAFFQSGTADHQFSAAVPAGAHNTSVYISPFDPTIDNDVSASWKVVGGAPQTGVFLPPVTDDTGIYNELPTAPGANLAFDVRMNRSGWSGHYLVTAQRVRHVFPLVKFELDGNLAEQLAPDLKTEDLIAATSVRTPYNSTIAGYLDGTDARYPRRVRESFVIATAFSLASTEGYLRFGSAELFHSMDSNRRKDVIIDSSCDADPRAVYWNVLGDYQVINMHRSNIEEPYDSGALTLFHEWGHYEFEYPDEYSPSNVSVDPNSIMGLPIGTVGYEFCTPGNHLNPPGIGAGPDSAWSNINAEFQIWPGKSPAFYPQNQATYMDVLHRLEQILEWEEFENNVAQDPVNLGACDGDPPIAVNVPRGF